MPAGITFSNAAKLGPYETALREAGIEPVRNPASLGALHGLLLTGGTDINPALYREAPKKSEPPDDARDALEVRLLEEALQAGVPVLGICRGLQMFNVVHGGTLIQHLASSDVHRQRPPRDAEPGKHPAAHGIRVAEGTRLAEIIGAGEHEVNSRHHQAAGLVDKRRLIVSAVASDGVIEGLERPGEAFAIAVQWHPEDRIQVSEADRKLFEAFAAAMRAYSRGSAGRTSRSTGDQAGQPRLSA